MLKPAREVLAKLCSAVTGRGGASCQVASWPTLIENVKTQEANFVGRTADEFRSIKAPMLIMVGDSDGVPLERVVEMFKLHGGGVFGDLAGLPDSQLAIIPGSSHVGIMQKPHLLLPMITEFLAAPYQGSH
jgi:pimeloyl-ACP methyl ester carboxylesterase